MSDRALLARTVGVGLVTGILAAALAVPLVDDTAQIPPTAGIWFLGGAGLSYGYNRYPDLVAADPSAGDSDGFEIETSRGWLAMTVAGVFASAVLFVGLMGLVSGLFDSIRAAAWAGLFFGATAPITNGVMVVYGLRKFERDGGGSAQPA